MIKKLILEDPMKRLLDVIATGITLILDKLKNGAV